MKENETNVAPEGTSPEPAKTAENLPPIAAPGASAGGAGELAQETVVSYPLHHHDVAQIDHLESRIMAIFEQWFGPKLDQAKAEILAKISELVTPIVAKSTEAQGAAPAATAEVPPISVAAPASRTGPTRGVMVEDQAHELAIGAPVKVWADPAHRTFLLGTIVAVHEGGAYDVETDDGVTKIPADGLEFDDRR